MKCEVQHLHLIESVHKNSAPRHLTTNINENGLKRNSTRPVVK